MEQTPCVLTCAWDDVVESLEFPFFIALPPRFNVRFGVLIDRKTRKIAKISPF